MQAIKGYLSNGRFTPYDDVALPVRIEAVLVFGETEHKPTEMLQFDFIETEKQARISWLNKIKKSLELSRDEDLSNFPKQGMMKSSYDDWFD